MKKVITATVGAALISGALLGAGPANADVYKRLQNRFRRMLANGPIPKCS